VRYPMLGFIAALALAGCGSSPEPSYYTLAPVASAATMEDEATVKIQRPSLPGYLDRPDIVRQAGDYRIDIDETRRWATPLDEMFERLLAEDLRQRMPSAFIVTERDEASNPRFIIETSIQNFNETGNGALLAAQLSAIDKEGCADKNIKFIPFRMESNDADRMQGLSTLIGQLADRIPSLIREQKTVCCPGQSPCTNQSDVRTDK